MLIAIVILLLGATQDATPAAAPHPGFDVAECQTCHEEVFRDFSHTHHAKKLARSCAECHGDVATHAKSMMEGEGPNPVISFKTLTAAQVNEKCLTCHDKRRQAHWTGGVHVSLVYPIYTLTEFHAVETQSFRLRRRGPVQTAEQVARAMLRCVRRPRAEVYPYRPARLLAGFAAMFPGLLDRMMGRVLTR